MPKVRATTAFVAEGGAHVAGDVFELQAEDAAAWIAAGLVERLEPEFETATRAPREAAVTRRGRR